MFGEVFFVCDCCCCCCRRKHLLDVQFVDGRQSSNGQESSGFGNGFALCAIVCDACARAREYIRGMARTCVRMSACVTYNICKANQRTQCGVYPTLAARDRNEIYFIVVNFGSIKRYDWQWMVRCFIDDHWPHVQRFAIPCKCVYIVHVFDFKSPNIIYRPSTKNIYSYIY